MKTTILGGAVFLIPLAFVAIVLGKAYEVGMLVAQPIERLVPIESIAGIAVANILAIVLILLLCYLAGLVAKSDAIARRVGRLDHILIDVVPGYAVAKGVIGGVANQKAAAHEINPVLVRFDDYDQIAFEIERTPDRCVVFLPGAPSAWSGGSVIVEASRVTALDIPPHQAVSLLRVLGRGTLPLIKAQDSAPKQV